MNLDPFPSTRLQLWNIAGGNPANSDCDWNATFDPVGLFLLAPPRNFGYWCTPSNSLAFATTGGDRVHYSLLPTGGAINDFSPVVMTVPMCDTPNTIVGANLKEFLALGCRYGYFALEQLVYDREETIQELACARVDPERGANERALLQKIASSFDLKPWTDVERRLTQLQKRFAATLKMSIQAENAV